MNKNIKQKTEQIKKKFIILFKNAKLSSDNYQSSSQPFFKPPYFENFKIGYNTLPELPERLNRNFKTFYEYVGNPNKKFILMPPPTIMSLANH